MTGWKRRAYAPLALAAMALALTAVTAVAGHDTGSAAAGYAGARPVPANTSYLLGAFLFVWAGLWAYLAALHKGQRRLERMIGRLEEKEK